jgi:hypothetical protein
MYYSASFVVEMQKSWDWLLESQTVPYVCSVGTMRIR